MVLEYLRDTADQTIAHAEKSVVDKAGNSFHKDKTQ
jgi:hypothetical protein